MRQLTISLLSLFYLCCCAIQSTTGDYYEDDFGDYVPFIGLRRDEFDWNLMKELVRTEQGNFVISPFSVKVVLMMIAEISGVQTKTRKELLDALDNISSVPEGRELFRNYLNSLIDPGPENSFQCGNILIVDEKLNTSPRVEHILFNNYFATTNHTDLKDVVGATKKINNWVAQITHNRIQELVSESSIADSVIMFLNVLHFEGRWKIPFDPVKTVPGSFVVLPFGRSFVNFMTNLGEYYYYESEKLDSKILRLPYTGRKFAMFIILPKRGVSLESVTNRLDHKTVNREAWYLDEYTVDVKIPKFNINFPVNLKPHLQALGINTIFNNEAELQGLVRGSQLNANQLAVSNIVQKAAIDVNEEGSTASAATQVQLINKINEELKVFHANRPFIFYIEDETTGNIIFAGQVTDPSNQT